MTAQRSLQCAYHVRLTVATSCHAVYMPGEVRVVVVHSLDNRLMTGMQGWTFDGESGECVNIPQVRCKAAPSMFFIMSPEGQLWQAFPVCELEAWGSRDCACAVEMEHSQGAMPRYGRATPYLHVCR